MLLACILLGVLLSALFCTLSAVRGLLLLPLFLGLSIVWSVAVFLLYLLCLLAVFLFLKPEQPPTRDHPFVRFLIVETVRLVCQVGRVHIRLEGAECLPEGRFLFVSNHRSLFDAMVALVALKNHPLVFVSKPENLSIPLVGRVIRYCGFLPIDRENPRNAIRTINAAANLIRKDVLSVGIYPEGTRNRNGTETLLPFHDGVLMIAQKAKAPIVVVSTQGTEKISRNFPFRRSDVTLRVCQVLPADEIVSVRTGELSARIREILERSLTNTSK